MTDTTTPAPELHAVVVVGGGLGGSAAAAFLSRYGLRPVVLERHHTPPERPRAWVISARTLELLRPLGLADAVARAGTPGTWNLQVTDTLREAQQQGTPPDETADVSPTGAVLCDQDIVEDILQRFATSHGADLRRGRTVTDLVDRGSHVEVRTAAGPPVLARYVVLAQGARADLLPGLGITSSNPGACTFEDFDQVLFRSTELDELMAGTTGKAFVCTANDTIVFRRDRHRWQLQRQGRHLEDPAHDIAVAVGQPVAVDVVDHVGWRPTSRLAGTFRAGHVFVVGDAAHCMPPSLGMAGNLAVQDAHNLAWKLAWVLQGRAGAALLDTYDGERRPVDAFVLAQSNATMSGRPTLDTATLHLGLGYPPGRSSALHADDGADSDSDSDSGDGDGVIIADPHDRTPRVGVRLPHQWLPDGRCALDLADAGALVLVGAVAPAGSAVPFEQLPAPPDGDDPGRSWLLRPDGIVAAAVAPGMDAARIRPLVDALLSRPGATPRAGRTSGAGQ